MILSRLDVTVVIPCFNRWPHVQKAIESVLAQSHPVTHCLVVDDASTDNSFDALQREYAGHPRVILLQLPENQGQSAARNLGAHHIETELVCFLDSDDLLFKDAVASRVSLYREDSVFRGIAFGSKLIANPDRTFPNGSWQRHDRLTLNGYLRNRDLMHTNTFMMPTACFLESGGFNESLRNQEDIELFLRLLTRLEARYSGEPCCRIEAVDTQRARHDLARIIEQGNQFTDAVKNNELLIEKADPSLIDSLIEHDTKVTLNALYKSRKNKEFRKLLMEAKGNGLVRLKGKLIKRYAISWFR